MTLSGLESGRSEAVMMTPRERLRAALRFEPYDGPVPHLELEFQLAEELLGG